MREEILKVVERYLLVKLTSREKDVILNTIDSIYYDRKQITPLVKLRKELESLTRRYVYLDNLDHDTNILYCDEIDDLEHQIEALESCHDDSDEEMIVESF